MNQAFRPAVPVAMGRARPRRGRGHPPRPHAARRLWRTGTYEVVAEAGSTATAHDAVEHYQPTAVLLDVRLGDDDGFAV
jgi:DNA-binding NarL/FixJ family response regulator